MKNPQKQIELVIRQAGTELIDQICDFYEKNRGKYLPVPSVMNVGNAIDDGRLIIVQRDSDSMIVASSAIFDFTPKNSLNHVFELSATRVTGDVGGLLPQKMQNVLIGVRIAQYVALETPVSDITQSLIAIINKENTLSKNNILEMGFQFLETLPKWIEYDNLSWQGASQVATEWDYYYANEITIKTNFKNLFELGLRDNHLALHRLNRTTKNQENVVIRIEMNCIKDSIEDLKKFADGHCVANLVRPPERIKFR